MNTFTAIHDIPNIGSPGETFELPSATAKRLLAMDAIREATDAEAKVYASETRNNSVAANVTGNATLIKDTPVKDTPVKAPTKAAAAKAAKAAEKAAVDDAAAEKAAADKAAADKAADEAAKKDGEDSDNLGGI
jgi:hypothetical protein